MRFIGVIPARYESTRLPGKALLRIAGKTIVQHVYERALEAQSLSGVLVATDDARILRAVEAFGGRALMTSKNHLSGTDRVAEVAALTEADVFVNIQGDEPLISPHTIDSVCLPFIDRPDLLVSTARAVLTEPEEIASPHTVKVVVDKEGNALYFSRLPIPYLRRSPAYYFKHLGIYAYRREFLMNLSSLKPSPLEWTEGLEQLRFLEHRVLIRTVLVEDPSLGIDTAEEFERVRLLMENASGSSEVQSKAKVSKGE